MSDRPVESSHARFRDDLAAYALGALQESELAEFEAHLDRCSRCREELATMREAVDILPSAAPPAAPPDDLRDRVMASVRQDLGEQSSARMKRTERRDRGRIALLRRPGWLTPGVAVAAAAVVAVLVVGGVLALGGGGQSSRTYAGVVHASGARASLQKSGASAKLDVAGLPAPPPRRIYEIWLKRNGRAPEPTRALFPTGNGSIAVPGDLHGVQKVLVTDEPRPNGSQAPTRPPIVVVNLA